MNIPPKKNAFQDPQPVRLQDARTGLDQVFPSLRAAASWLGANYLPELFPDKDRKGLFINHELLRNLADWHAVMLGGPMHHVKVTRTSWLEEQERRTKQADEVQ